MTTDDQIAVHGTLESGAVAAMHFRGGESPTKNLYWEINGTDGDLVVTGDLGYLHLGSVTVRGRQGTAGPPEQIDVPTRYESLPALTPRHAEPLYTVAHSYARLHHDLVNGTSQVPTFEHAARRHRVLDAIANTSSARAAEQFVAPREANLVT
jgi:predicted dehydrogenase